MMRVRVTSNGRFAFGVHEWGGPLLAVPYLAGAVIRAERIRCLSPGGAFDFYVSQPVYVEGLDGSLVVLELEGDRLREDVLDGDGCREAWEAWFGAIGAVDVQQQPPVPEALQPATKEPYSSQRTEHTTTTKPRKAPTMTAKTATTETPTATADEARTKSAVSKDGTAKCPSCKENLPVTKYPTAKNAEGTYERDMAECRRCRDSRRAARKAEPAKATQAA